MAGRVIPELREECGVFAVYGHPDAVLLTYYGLYALQHRGQESAGIVAAAPGEPFVGHRGMGLVSEVFSRERLRQLAGEGRPIAVGHVRYSTTGASVPENAQPLLVRCRGGHLAIAHNGNLVNGLVLRRRLEADGAIFQTTTDTEVIAHLIARQGGPWREAVLEALRPVRGGYALAILTPEGLLGVRDPHGIRPLVLGWRDGAWILSSETCALDAVGAEPVRELEPGQWVWLQEGEPEFGYLVPPEERRPAFCAFEFVYFARPDSVFMGRTVHEVRKELGRRLAREAPVEADVVIGVPESSIPAAAGYSEESGIPHEQGLIKNRYVGRTFIRPDAGQRAELVRLKLNPVRDVVAGKRVVLVDDSLVRGTTTRYLVRALRQAGAREVHLRITSPPYRFSCYYGIDTADREQLIAARRNVEEIRQVVGADSLHFLSVEGMLDAIGLGREGFCLGCFTGIYPVPPEEEELLLRARGGGVLEP